MSVYVISANNRLKVGFSDDPKSRARGIRFQYPGAVLLAVIDGGRDKEAQLQARLAEWSLGNEWFADTPQSRDVAQDYMGVQFSAIDTSTVTKKLANVLKEAMTHINTRPHSLTRIRCELDLTSVTDFAALLSADENQLWRTENRQTGPHLQNTIIRTLQERGVDFEDAVAAVEDTASPDALDRVVRVLRRLLSARKAVRA